MDEGEKSRIIIFDDIQLKLMDELETQATILVQKMRRYLITEIGKTMDQASDEDIYRALVNALRESIMIHWTATNQTLKKPGLRKVYYLSMEYMPGRLLGHTIVNMGAVDLIKRTLKKLGKGVESLCEVEPDIGIGNGGLGRLASCFLDSLATLHYPSMGYGLRYHYGIFEQELICGVQIERPDCWLLNPNPWELRRDGAAVSVRFGGTPIARKNSHGDTVFDLIDYEEVRSLPYDFPIVGYSADPRFSVLTLRLWSTKESPKNFALQKFNAGDFGQANENTNLTDVLYPNDNHEAGKRIRLKQEFLLVSASLQDIVHQYKEIYSDWSHFPDVVRIQINDTHPAWIIPEFIHLLTMENDLPWERAWEIVQTCCGYTNHTVLKEALEEWNVERIFELLPRHYSIVERLNAEFCSKIRKRFPGDEEKVRRMSFIEKGQIKMANLAIYGSHKINGVAALHTKILKTSLFKDFYDLYPEKFANVTNGITQRRWLLICNPLLAEFLEERIGNRWITHFEEISKIRAYASDPDSQMQFIQIKKKNKERFLKWLEKEMALRHVGTNSLGERLIFDPNVLFAAHIKRIHEYKRQLMNALHLLMLYFEIKDNPHSDRMERLAIFGGKAAPGYQMAKAIIRLIYCLARKIDRDPAVSKKLKIIYIENYNVSKAELIIPATDLSEQISTAGMEASGTGNMKFSLNGALTIATEDGANVEMREQIGTQWWPFTFGQTSEENLRLWKEGSYNSQEICKKNPQIHRALQALQNGYLVENSAEHAALLSIYTSLIRDPFFVLNDLGSYYETEKRVDMLYKNPHGWAEHAIHNLAGMGSFSSDVSIQAYAQTIWNITPCPLDTQALFQAQQEYRMD